MYIKTTDRHVEHINTMTYFEDYGLFINEKKIGVRPEKAKDTYDFILESICNGAILVDLTKPLERSRHDSESC